MPKALEINSPGNDSEATTVRSIMKGRCNSLKNLSLKSLKKLKPVWFVLALLVAVQLLLPPSVLALGRSCGIRTAVHASPRASASPLSVSRMASPLHRVCAAVQPATPLPCHPSRRGAPLPPRRPRPSLIPFDLGTADGTDSFFSPVLPFHSTRYCVICFTRVKRFTSSALTPPSPHIPSNGLRGPPAS